ncbi:MAG: TIGR03960 family B12-binding radical SAM protein [Saccharofermentanales bacterium]
MSTVKIPRSVLLSVTKPARYIGGEWNSVVKDITKKKYNRFAFCFPDIYDIGMSHLGMKILYHMLNERDDTYCERCFAPWDDMREQMIERSIPLFTLETSTPVNEFDIVGFTLQYEMCYSNVLLMLDLARIPLYAKDRMDSDPIVIAGGPCTYNIEPMADFFDIAFIGESEEQLNHFMDLYDKYKKEGKITRREFLMEVAIKVKGAYVPSLYNVSYNEDGTISSVKPVSPENPEKITKAVIMDLDNVFYPTNVIVPNTEVVHDRIFLEIFRGCTRGCRFCQAGFISRPVREKSPETLMALMKISQAETGYDEIGLLSLSTGDYTRFAELTTPMLCDLEKTHSSLSLPSLRVDSFSLDIMEKAQKTRKSGLTFAPEAGTERLRKVINKGITEDDMMESMKIAFDGGWNNIKLYFMLGLPTETMEDVEGIAELVRKIEKLYYSLPAQSRKRPLELTVSAAMFIPKPFTPFQLEAQDTMESLDAKQQRLRSLLKSRSVKFQWHGSKTSFWEGVLARGDRRLGKVIYDAYQAGCRFDSWDDHFKLDIYMKCMEQENLSPEFYANRKREDDEILPWDHIDCGVTKEFFLREKQAAYNESGTPQCRLGCSSCGVMKFGGDICLAYKSGK